MRTEPNRRWDDVSRVRWVAYAALVAVLVAFIAGRVSGRAPGSTIASAEAAPVPSDLPRQVSRFHDASQGVTCWLASNYSNGVGGISCLPDQWLASWRIEADQP